MAAAPRPAVGLVGVGRMGLAMAARLRSLGWPVRARDIDPDRESLARELGATTHADAGSAARGCAALIVAVVDAAQTYEVLFGAGGAVHGLAPGAAVLLCPTIAPEDVEDCVRRLAALGFDGIDAPMSGGPQRARDGTMSLMVACPAPVFERLRGLLGDLAAALFHVGERAGNGARMKLVNNLLAAANLAAAAEALALAARIGLDPQATLAVIERSSGASWIGSDRLRRAIAGDDAVHARVALLAKDAGLALDMARGAGCGPAVGGAAAQLFAQACAEGLAEADDSALWRWLGATAAAPESAR
jgi:3-hydroxyisobutyrate dehydrogenase